MTSHDDSALRAVLDSRAERLAAVDTSGETREPIGLFVLVDIGERRLGLPIELVREVAQTPPIVALPGLPAWLPGLVQLRGEILCVVDLSLLYALPPLVTREALAVVRDDRGILGLLVDRVVGFREVFADELTSDHQESPLGENVPSTGLTRDLVLLLQLRALFNDERVVVGGDPTHSGVS